MSAVTAVVARRRLELGRAARRSPFRMALAAAAAVVPFALLSRAGMPGPVAALPPAQAAGFGWYAVYLLAMLAAIQVALASTTSTLLAQAAGRPASRFRAIVLDALLSGMALPMLATAALVARQGTPSPGWIAVCLTVTPAVALAGFCAPIVFVRAAERGPWRSTALVALALAVPPAAIVLVPPGLSPGGIGLAVVALLAGTTLVVALGPGAGWLGTALDRAGQAVEARQPVVRVPPGLLARRIARRLDRWRSPVWAMARKDLLVQSRDPMHILRVAVVVVSVPAWTLLGDRVRTATGLDGAELVAAFVAVACGYSLFDLSPSPLGAEANRVTLFIHGGATPRQLVAGKLVTFAYVVLIEMLAIVTLLVVLAGVAPGTAARALPLALLVAGGATATLVLLSATDIDPERALDNEIEERIAEHLPFSAARMLVLLAMSLLLVDSVALMVVLDGAVMVAAIAAEHAVVVGVGWLVARRSLRRLAPSWAR